MNWNDDFTRRVNFAAARISSGGGATRRFDGCFENDDGSEVAVAVYRRSLKNPRLAANIWRYLSKDTVMGDVEKLKDVKTRDLPAHAAESRRRSREEFATFMERKRNG